MERGHFRSRDERNGGPEPQSVQVTQYKEVGEAVVNFTLQLEGSWEGRIALKYGSRASP